MAGASTSLHESPEILSPLTHDLHRALVSLQEELEAVDWYRQRAEGATDEELREVLLHNMGEEIEHASLLLEWIRRREPLFDKQLRTYLFTSGSLLKIEKAAEQEEKGSAETPHEKSPSPLPPLTVGTLKGE